MRYLGSKESLIPIIYQLLDKHGYVMVSSNAKQQDAEFIREITKQPVLNQHMMSPDFLWYLAQRNLLRDFSNYFRLSA